MSTAMLKVKLTLHEVLALYLAARLLFLSFNQYSPHVYSGMNKLAESLENVFPLLGGFIHTSARHLLAQSGSSWKGRIAVLEKLTIAWAENKKVVISYRSKTGELHTYTAAIYFMEPYPAGKTIYVFARTDEDGSMYTFRVDRVSEAAVTAERYSIPGDFDFAALFSHAWGI